MLDHKLEMAEIKPYKKTVTQSRPPLLNVLGKFATSTGWRGMVIDEFGWGRDNMLSRSSLLFSHLKIAVPVLLVPERLVANPV
jgi:hypothetical protein